MKSCMYVTQGNQDPLDNDESPGQCITSLEFMHSSGTCQPEGFWPGKLPHEDLKA